MLYRMNRSSTIASMDTLCRYKISTLKAKEPRVPQRATVSNRVCEMQKLMDLVRARLLA